MTLDDAEIVLHTIKAIEASYKRHDQYKDAMYDQMFKELNVQIPERRKEGDRRRDKAKIDNGRGLAADCT